VVILRRYPFPSRCCAGAIAALAIVAFSALAHPEQASAAVAAPAQVSPDLSAVPVDSLEVRAAQTRLDTSDAALADAQNIVANGAAELDRLHSQDTQLTAQLAAQTAAKKQATVDLASARATLRAIAVASYAGAPGIGPVIDPASAALATGDAPAPTTADGSATAPSAADLDTSTLALERRSLAAAVSTSQSDRATAARQAVDTLSGNINGALSQRTAARQRMLKVQQIQNQAAANVAEYAAAVASAQADLDHARITAIVVGADFELVALDAYRRAAAETALVDPECGITWWALAGITRVESKHGTLGGSTLLFNGDTSQPIVGVPLDGSNNTALIPDTDGGALDGDPVYDRAVGPMQFIPSTWRRYGVDGNGDGVANPNNIYDAAATAARYLCRSGPMQTDDDMTRGFLSYNHSDTYAAMVLGFAKAYAALPLNLP
jgi:membrane-bound lytic murein transglycosylase B